MTTVTRGRTGQFLERVRRALKLRRTRGLGRVGYAFLRHVGRQPVIRSLIGICAIDMWRLPLNTPRPAPRTSSLFTVRFATPDDLPALEAYFGDPRRIDARLARRDLCVIALSEQQIGAAVWVSTGPNEIAEDWDELRCRFRYPSGVAWAYDGKGTKIGAWGTMMKQLPALLRKWDIGEVATIIDCDNWQSFDAHKSLGYEAAGILLCVNLFGWAWHLYKPVQQGWQRVPACVSQVEVVR